MRSKSAIALLDKFYPPCGPCMFCKSKDKRHRLWDAFMNFDKAGESAEKIQREYPDCTIEHIKMVLQIRPYRRGGSLPANARQ